MRRKWFLQLKIIMGLYGIILLLLMLFLVQRSLLAIVRLFLGWLLMKSYELLRLLVVSVGVYLVCTELSSIICRFF